MAMGNKRETVRAGATIETLEARQLMSALYVSNSGNDGNSGSMASPLASLQAAVNHARSGDTIIMRGGTYSGGVRIDTSNLTIKSQAGETAKIVSPNNNAGVEVNIRIGEHANNVRLQGLDLSGGYYYTIKTESTWDTGDSNPTGPQNLTIADCKIHDSGRDVIKLTPRTDHVRIVRNEIYNSGRRDGSNAEGIDAVQANYASVLNNYIHDTTTNGMYFKGGSVQTMVARNRLNNIGHSGILIGQSSDENWFDTSKNPNYYESIDSIVKSNIITNCQGAGIGAWAALRPRIIGNTLVNVAQSMFGGLLVQGQEHWPAAGPQAGQDVVVPSTDVTMMNNIVQVPGGRPAVDVRSGGLTGSLKMHHNLYFSTSGAARFQYDDKNFTGSLSQWQAMGYDAGSKEANPKFANTNTYELAKGSPAVNAGVMAGGYLDFDNTARQVGAQDIGAQEFKG